MQELVQRRSFKEFGPTFLADNATGLSARIEIPSDRLAARKFLREMCPLTPGVYGWLDPNGQLGYVGKSKSLRKRLLSYFSKTVADEKMNRIRRNSRSIIWQPISHELLALLREQELINRWRPSFNSQGQPTRRKPAFVCISNAAAPNAILQRQLTTKSTHRFGPIMGTAQLREAVENLNNVFKLRDCPDKTTIEYSNQMELFAREINAKCIRHELATCPAPCAAACSQSEYMSSVEKAIAFLNGFDQSILEQLEVKMNAAAEKKAFEAAAIFRDRWESLSWLDRRLEMLRRAQLELNCVYQVPGFDETKVWLVMDSGLPIDCVKVPDSPAAAAIAEPAIRSIAAKSRRFPDGPLETNFQMIVLSWFRHRKPDRQQLLSVNKALRMLRGFAGSAAEKKSA